LLSEFWKKDFLTLPLKPKNVNKLVQLKFELFVFDSTKEFLNRREIFECNILIGNYFSRLTLFCDELEFNIIACQKHLKSQVQLKKKN